MKSIRFTLLIWVICIISCTASVFNLARSLAGLSQPATLPVILSEIAWGLYPIILPLLTALIVSKRPQNSIGGLLMLQVVYFPVAVSFTEFLKSYTVAPSVLTPILWMVVWADMWIWIPLIFPIFLIALLFPTGQPPSSRWRWIIRLALGLVPAFLLLAAFSEELEALDAGWSVPNPLGIIPDGVGLVLLTIWQLGLALVALASGLGLVVRFLRGSAVERQQLKWLLFAFAILLPLFLAGFVFKDHAPPITNALGGLSFLAIPISITIAILRHQLWNIDVVIRKTLVYSLLTGLLGVLYFGGVALLQGILTADRGQQTADANAGGPPSAVIIVVTTLTIAALFNPLRRRLQETIDRRFYRQKYDAEKALADFAAAARSQANLPALTSSLVSVVQETVQPEEVKLWLKS